MPPNTKAIFLLLIFIFFTDLSIFTQIKLGLNIKPSFYHYLTVGCSVKLWYGGGEGNVHSKPCAPSQT